MHLRVHSSTLLWTFNLQYFKKFSIDRVFLPEIMSSGNSVLCYDSITETKQLRNIFQHLVAGIMNYTDYLTPAVYTYNLTFDT